LPKKEAGPGGPTAAEAGLLLSVLAVYASMLSKGVQAVANCYLLCDEAEKPAALAIGVPELPR
jgi:hypothetical protein